MASEHPQTKISTKERLQNTADFIIQHEVTIMETASIPSTAWDELMVKSMLGSLYPTTVLAKALLANIQQHSDTLLVDTILEYLRSGNGPKRCKANHVKEWYTILHDSLQESSTTLTVSLGDTNVATSTGATPFMERMKVEIKLDQYDGTVDECAEWFYTLEKTLITMRIPMQDFLLYATNNTAGTA
jgi:hypothetical protein